MTARKNTATTVEIVPATETAPAPVFEPSLSLIVATPQVIGRTEAKIAAVVTENSLHNVRAEKTAEVLTAEYLRHRRMFPAIESVQNILGPDTPDLAGRSPEYKAAIKNLNETSRDLLVAALRKEGMTIKGATSQADAELERIRKSVSRSIRLAVEEEARALVKAEGRVKGATFLLGHGFGYSGETPKDGRVIESKEWALKDGTLALPAGKVLSENGRDVVDQVMAEEPAEQADQASPSQQADDETARLLKAAGVTVGDPVAIINLAIGLLNGATTLVAEVNPDLPVRNALRKALLGATKNVANALVPPAKPAEVAATK
jgi:hypothetical protein